MKVGTKSVLFGAHCFIIHPFFVAAAWWKLYGFPWDPRLWLAFFVHDLGYWGKPNMDGPEGETHVELGADIMFWLCDIPRTIFKDISKLPDEIVFKWYNFSKYHSRFYAKKDGVSYSKLCLADKLAICLEPSWLYLPRANWSGEIHEYMKLSAAKEGDSPSKYTGFKLSLNSQRDWLLSVQKYLQKWVDEHKDMKVDTWTLEVKKAINAEGVWQ
ncbi:MAG: hypothetical protein M1292_01815 [Bacteroidetes bacterium]|nr:hypothetical protein [Bacteroidota bacterium]